MAIALVLIALSFGFATLNRAQAIQLSFGIATWRGPAVHALFVAGVLGLLAMFLLGLPADLRARSERRRLERRLRAVERELEAERALHPAPAPTPPELAGEGVRNREEGGTV